MPRLNQYKAGTVPYTSVITEQELLLADQQTLLSAFSRAGWWTASH